MKNIQHSTSNIERRMISGPQSRSMFSVRCSVFDVFRF